MSSKKVNAVERTFGLAEYFAQSKDLFTSIMLVIPVYVIYQVGVLTTGGVRNGVDFVTDVLWAVTGQDLWIYLAFNLGVLVVFGAVAFFLRKRGSFNPKVFPALLVESTIYAIGFGSVVIGLMSVLGLDVLLASGSGGEYGPLTAIVLSLGAGVFEETVFRLILLGGLFLLGTKVLNWPTWLGALVAVLVSSFIFSAVHYIGPLGDAFALGSFLFRFFAGVILAVIFYFRGFAVAVYTHAIYDVIVMVFN